MNSYLLFDLRLVSLFKKRRGVPFKSHFSHAVYEEPLKRNQSNRESHSLDNKVSKPWKPYKRLTLIRKCSFNCCLCCFAGKRSPAVHSPSSVSTPSQLPSSCPAAIMSSVISNDHPFVLNLSIRFTVVQASPARWEFQKLLKPLRY